MTSMNENITPEIRHNARETEILYLLAQRYSEREIALFLGISVQTVYNNICFLKRLTCTNDLMQLRDYAQKRGFGIKQSPRITEGLNPSMLKPIKTEVTHSVAES